MVLCFVLAFCEAVGRSRGDGDDAGGFGCDEDDGAIVWQSVARLDASVFCQFAASFDGPADVSGFQQRVVGEVLATEDVHIENDSVAGFECRFAYRGFDAEDSGDDGDGRRRDGDGLSGDGEHDLVAAADGLPSSLSIRDETRF